MNTFGLPKMKGLPSEYFLEHFVVTTSGMNFSVPLRATLEALGPERILFAADYPMEILPDQVKGTESTDLPVDVKKRIFETNPTRVFKL